MERKDFYFRKAKEEGYLARSVYKLLEINKKYNLIRKEDRVLDIGCSPGSWVQACLKLKVSEVIGIDIQEAKVEDNKFKFFKKDINKINLSNWGEFNVVLSDIAPSTSGNKDLDSSRSYELSLKAFEITKKVLKEHGNFLVKIFQGEEFPSLLTEIKNNFVFCKSFKPKSTRSSSKEIYIIAKGYRKAI